MNDTTRLLEEHVLEHREQLLRFIRSKVSDSDLAEDILQQSVLKALRAAPDLHEHDKVASWLYQIIRNAIVDTYRRRETERKYTEQYAREVDVQATPEDRAALCACFRALLPTLKPEHAELIEAMELGNEAPETMAEQLGITRNNLKVRRYRARQQLRRRLEETCRACAEHGCLDCTCSAEDRTHEHPPATPLQPA